jgi:glycosyltransferase involved in cell wall biosynthesis
LDSPLRIRKGWGADKFVLLSTRSWSPLYGVEDLARAFVRAAELRPELRLLMLGGGPLSAKIHAIFQNAGLIDRVHFPGQVNQAELPLYYHAADLYISTSHSDGTSISLLEALASGNPVLLSDIPGNREWVTSPGEVGWLFEDGNANDLEKAILHAVDNRSELDGISGRARRLAEKRGDWDKNFPSLLKAWQLVDA